WFSSLSPPTARCLSRWLGVIPRPLTHRPLIYSKGRLMGPVWKRPQLPPQSCISHLKRHLRSQVASSVVSPMCFRDSVSQRRKISGSPVRSGPMSLLRSISLASARYVSWALQPKGRGVPPPRQYMTEGGERTCARYERVLTV